MVRKRKNAESSRGQLDISQIVQVAIDLLNEVGIHSLTMRKLADSLGIRAASLYYHIKDKSELLQLIAEKISERIQIPDSALPWQEQILIFMKEYRSALLEVRDSAEVLIDSTPFTPKRLKTIDVLYKIFLDIGLPPEEVLMVTATINNYVMSYVLDEMKMLSMAKEQGKTVKEIVEAGNEIFRNLPKDQYPSLVFIADSSPKIDMEKEFLYGLEIILSGITKRLTR